MAGPPPAYRWRHARHRTGRRQRNEPVLLDVLLDRPRQCKQSLLDGSRHVAGVAQGLTTILEHLCFPGDALHQLIDLVGVGGGEYNLICLTDGLALDNEGSTTAGNGIWQWTLQSGNTNQEWSFQAAP